MTELEDFLTKLHQNLSILRVHQAKYFIDTPLSVLNQIEKHETAITLTEQFLRGELSNVDWQEALQALDKSNLTEPTNLLTKLHYHLNILHERKLKYFKDNFTPISLLNQIEDYQTAITLTENFLCGELSESKWQEELRSLLINIEGINNQLTLPKPWALFVSTRNSNPYIAGPPITTPPMFFGRQADLKKVIGLLKNNFVMLTGPRRIGKTSLLYQLAYHLPRLEDTIEQFIPVLINTEGTSETEFFHLLMEEIISAIQLFLPHEIVATLSFDLANSTYPARAFSRDLQTILKSLQTTTPRSSRLVLLLDEMDTLNNYSLETQAQLRRIFQRFTNTNLSVVVAGVNLRQHWAGESSPFYNMFIPITLTPFPEAEARRLITEPVQGRYTYTDEAMERILEATLGLPHRIQQLCLEIINHGLATLEGSQEITPENVDNVLQTIQWLDETVIAQDQIPFIPVALPIIAEEKGIYQPTNLDPTNPEVQ